MLVHTYISILILSWVTATCTLAVTGSSSLHKIPENASYAASDTTYDDGGLGPMFDFARSFINTALPDGFPKDFINETWNSVDGKGVGLNIGDLAPKLLKTFAGYVAALVVGFLFILIFPIVGCCFGCCRLCGNCGGKRKQAVTSGLTKKLDWRRRIYTFILLIISAFMIAGNICTYVSNKRMTVAIDTIENTVKDNLDDIDTYLNLVETQIEMIGVVNLQITKNTILQNMDNTTLEKNISNYILNEMSSGALNTMDSNINIAKEAFGKVTKAVKTVDSTFAIVKSVCSSCRNPTASQEFKDLQTHSQDFDSFSSNSVVEKVKKQLQTQIATKLTSLSTQRQAVQKAFKKIEDKVQHVVDEVKKFKSNADSGIDLEYYKQKVTSVMVDVKKYDKYRYGAGAGLAAMTTLIIALQLLGVMFGTFGQLNNPSPTSRSCVSHNGGNLLIASAVFIFMFASLLMLLTTISFAIGSLLERFICQPLAPPSMELLEVANAHLPTKDTLRADLSSVIRDCRDGKTAYSAFHLSSMFNLTAVDGELHDQEKEINKQMQTALNGITTMGGVSFNTSASLNKFKDSLQNIKFTTLETQLDQTISSLRNIQETDQFRQSLVSLKDGLVELQNVKDKVDGWNKALTDSLQTVTTDMGAVSKMKNVLDAYKAKIINVAEEFVNSTKGNIENRVGRCTPLWNLYNSIILVSVCQYTVDAFNGFWFSIGWCIFFFIPSVIFAMKLSKYYLRMDYTEDKAPHGVDRQESVGLSHLHRNKVGHSDNAHY